MSAVINSMGKRLATEGAKVTLANGGTLNHNLYIDGKSP